MTTQDRIKKDLKYAGFFTISNVHYSKEYKQNISQPIFLTVKNWDNYKDQFVKERSELYPDYKPNEIKRFELDILNEFDLYLNRGHNVNHIDKNEYKVLIMRYSEALSKTQKANNLTAPTKRIFCELVNDSGLIAKGEESATTYCKQVCDKYNLEYTDNVRKHFSTNNRLVKKDKNLKKVIELILPAIPPKERVKIQSYIVSKIGLYT